MRLVLVVLLFIWFDHLRGILTCLNGTRGHGYSLECVNDYLFTIRCELTAEPRPCDAFYWLEFYVERKPFRCELTSQTYPWVCVLNLSTWVEDTFMDTDLFQISLNYSFHGDNGSAVLETSYKPVNHIQPVPPSNLTVLWKQDEAVFHWLSGYDGSIMLVPYLQYELRIHRNGKELDVHSMQTNVSVPVATFVPYTNYTACVRSAPRVPYKGVWSVWGPAIYWKTGSTSTKKNADTPYMSLAPVWSALFLLPVILLCYTAYTRWKRYVRNPSPAPHIGEFKCSGILPEKVGELLQREESLQIDSLTEELSLTQQEQTSDDVNDSSGYTSFSASPRSPSTLQSSVDSKGSMSSWMQVLMSAERGSVMYSDDYCTLSYTLSEHAVNLHKS